MSNPLHTVTRIDGYLYVQQVKLEARYLPGKCQDGPVLIFLHEGLGCVEMWHDFPERLVNRAGLSGLVYSRQGYGRSDPCELPRSLRYMHKEAVEVLPEFLKAANISRYILVGHSDGGSISLIHAGEGNAPGLCGLITLAPHVFCEELSVNSIADAKTAYVQGDLRERLMKYHSTNVDCAFRGWNDAWLDPGFRAWNIEEYLPAVGVPHLVLQGEDDQYGTASQIRSIVENSGSPVEAHFLAGCGHSVHKDQTGLSLDLIADFVSRISIA